MTSAKRTLSDWLDYIKTVHSAPIEMGLERILAVKQRLNIEINFPLITVAGTNGKGSTCALLEAIWRAAGYSTGMFTSPHLLRYNERIQIDGQQASDSQLCAAFAEIDAARNDISLTYFEFSTLAALILFKKRGVQIAILEVGLGGRLDAVNVFDCDCAIITSIGIDHVHYLGNTRDAIGYEKAGVVRAQKPLVCGDPDPPASVISYANKIGAPLRLVNRDFGFNKQASGWDFWHLHTSYFALPYPALFGEFQLYNASAALAAINELNTRLPLNIADIRQGLLSVAWPGRFQVKPGRPMVILDVAHNPLAATALSAALNSAPPAQKTYAVFGMLKDKDISAVIETMAKHVDVWLLTELATPRAARASDLRRLLAQYSPTVHLQIFPSPLAAYTEACRVATENDRILIFGSFYTVAPILELIQGG